MSFFDAIPYDYMPKGSFMVTANGVYFDDDVPQKLRERFLRDLKRNREIRLETQMKMMHGKNYKKKPWVMK